MALNDKQQRFAAEYLVDLNATQAALRAGYSAKTAYSQGQRLLKHVEIQAKIQELKKKRAIRTEITQDRVIEEYAKIAFFDPRKMFDENGLPLMARDLDDQTAGALISLETKRGRVVGFKAADKIRALEALGRHLGMFDGEKNADSENEHGCVMLPEIEEGEA